MEVTNTVAHSDFASAIIPQATPLKCSVKIRRFIASDFAQKVIQTSGAQVISILLGVVTTIVIARALGPAGRGLYAVAVATGALGVQFSNLGLPTSNIYFAARKRGDVAALFGNTLLVGFGGGAILALALGVVFAVHPALLSVSTATVILVLIGIPIGLAYLLMQNILLGLQNVWKYNIVQIVSKLVPLILIFGLIRFGSASVCTMYAASLIGLAVACALIYRELTIYTVGSVRVSGAVFRDSISYATKAYLGALFCFLVLRADLFIVKLKLGATSAGYYSIVGAMGDILPFLSLTIGVMLFPKLSASDDIVSKLRLTYRAVIATAAIMAPLLGLSVVMCKSLVRAVFGPSFLPAAVAWNLLAPGIFFLSLESVAVQFFNSIGYPVKIVVMWLVCCVLNIALNLVAVPRYGIAGASIISTLCYFLAFVFVLLSIHFQHYSLTKC
jgi:O-antigen/teichoic acid export membrane protein